MSSRVIRKIIERIASQQLPPEVALQCLKGLDGPHGPLLPTPKEGDAAPVPTPRDQIPAHGRGRLAAAGHRRAPQTPRGARALIGIELAFRRKVQGIPLDEV